MRQKSVHGFQTGDLVKALVPSGKKAGSHQGKVAIRATGSFNITTLQGVVQGVSHRHCQLLQRADGYSYFNVAKMERDQVCHTAKNASRSALYLTGMPLNLLSKDANLFRQGAFRNADVSRV